MTARRRVAWGLIDQVLSSASNLAVAVVAARTVSASSFGVFSIAFTGAVVATFLARGLASDPLATAHSSDSLDDLAAASSATLRMALLSGLAGTAAALLAAGLTDGVMRETLFALAVILPGLTAQDSLRFILIVQGNARLTLLNDLLWAVLLIPLLGVVMAMGGGAPMLLLAWGAAGNVAALVGVFQARVHLHGRESLRGWLRRHRNLWPFYVLDNLLFQFTQLLLIVAISWSSSLADVGGLRAAVTLYTPLTIVGRGIVGVAVPELARRGDPRLVHRTSLLLAWALTPLALVWALAAMKVPDRWGEAAFGASWSYAHGLILPAGITVAVSMFTVGTVVGIRALGAGGAGLTARVVVSLLTFACGVSGALWNGASGAVWMLAASSPLQIGVWWWLLASATRRRQAKHVRTGPDLSSS